MTLGFIILRHVNSIITNNYWIHCYNCIRTFYPENHIIIIDDNSNTAFLSQKELYNTNIINSEYPGRGEILPYIYYLRNNFFDTAVMLHDSVFINKAIDFSTNTYTMLWHFEHNWDQYEDETQMINLFCDKNLLKFYEDKSAWKGCFGGMSVITHSYLSAVNIKYNIDKLINSVRTRYNRCSFERVIAVLLQIDHIKPSLLGDIITYVPNQYDFSKKDNYLHLPIIKVWTGR